MRLWNFRLPGRESLLCGKEPGRAPPRRGGSTTRSYEVSADGKQLQVTTRMENPRLEQPVTMRFGCDAVKSGG